MMANMDALWLSCVITDTQYARGVYEWKRRILRLAGQIRQIATRAVLAARRKETAEIAAEPSEPQLSDVDKPATDVAKKQIVEAE